MPKKVLIAETVDATRRTTDSLLRQNGFDVISVTSAERALEVLQFARPDLVLLGSALTGADGRPFYELLQDDARWSSIPLLVVQAIGSAATSLPSEVVIIPPIEPTDFLQRVNVFVGAVTEQIRRPGPLAVTSVDDQFLDAALGLDRLDVVDSEVMDKTSISKAGQRSPKDKLIGIDGDDSTGRHNESGRVETLMIRDEKTDFTIRPTPAPPKPAATSTGKIEIIGDQFGMTAPLPEPERPSDQPTDYDWFVNSMRDEIAGPPKPEVKADSGKIALRETAAILDPVNAAPATAPVSSGKSKSTVGVERFIDEFKKEIEALRATEPDAMVVSESAARTTGGTGGSWSDTIEHVSAEQVQLFTRQLARDIADSLAERIAAKIDASKLLQLLADEIVARQNRR